MRAFQAQSAKMKVHLGGPPSSLPAKTFQAVDGVVTFDGDDLPYANELVKLMKSGTRPDVTQQLREMDAATTEAFRKSQEAKRTPAAARGVFSTATAPGQVQRQPGQGGPPVPTKSVPAAGGVGAAEAKQVDTMPGSKATPGGIVPARDPGTAGPNAAGDASQATGAIPAGSDVANRIENTERRSVTDRLREDKIKRESEAAKLAAANVEAAAMEAALKGPK